MRILAAIRLSRLADETTSVATQRQALEGYARLHGHQIVAVTEDLDVSGGMPIRARPGVGPWLSADRLDDWDAIAGYRLDRLFRDHYDFVTFYRDVCQRHGKSVISVSEGIDMTTPTGRMIAGILVQFAEWERTRASERRLDATASLRRFGYWQGGKPIFGYRPEPEGDHFILVPDPDHAPIVRALAADVIRGESASKLAADLTARGVPTPHRAARWSATTILRLLRNETLRGYVTHDGKIFRDESGFPLRREPILDDDTWHRLQDRLARPPRPPVRRYGAALLAGVLYCGKCDRRMYVNRYTRLSRRGVPVYMALYRCSRQQGGCGRTVMAEPLESEVAADLLDAYGAQDIPEPRLIPAVDHSARLADLDRLVADLDVEYSAGALPASAYARQVANLEAERDRLAAEPTRPVRIEYVSTGVRFAARWAALDAEGRNRLLVHLGARIVYGDGLLLANLRTIDDLRRAMGE